MRRLLASGSMALALCAPPHVTAETVLEKVVIFSRHRVGRQVESARIPFRSCMAVMACTGRQPDVP
ncbi:MAG: hypothetical protein ABW003_07530, partial [Microvirga sp.]